MCLWEYKLTEEELKPIWADINQILADDFYNVEAAQHLLSGNLKHEYFLERSVDHLNRVITPQIDQWEQATGYLHSCAYNASPHLITSLGAWVNFQQKNEVNPLHHHGGVISWVLWLKIPYTRLAEQAACPEQTPDQVVGGKFAFAYTNILGRVETATWSLDPSYEGTLLIFPSQLKHMVYPFKSSDDYRISLSGNYAFAV
jgi:hypothetical protein